MRVPFAIFAAFAALAASPAARADDPYSPSSFGSAPPARWSGIEFGLDLGGVLGSTGGYTSSGFIGGGHLGYNIQMGGFVAGVEGDALVSNSSGSASYGATIDTNWLDSVRGKAGYAFGPWLAYGELGGAYSWMTYSNGAGSFSVSNGGYVFGAGGEYAVMPNISLRGELRRYLMSDTSFAVPGSSLSGSTGQTMILFGVSGRF